jgi:hypothetical protein
MRYNVFNMKNLQKGSTLVVVLVVIIIILLGVVGYSYWKSESRPQQTPEVNTQAATDLQTKQQSTNVTYKTYNGNGYSFEYPSNWRVRENYYATPGQQDAGQKGDVVSLSVISPTGQEIVIGGRQAQCRPSTATVKAACFKNDIPIVMSATDAQSVAAFDHLIATLK